MIAPTLTPSEIPAVRAARSMRVVEYAGGSRKAMCGNTALFAAGCAEAFGELWRQAERVRAEVKRG